MTMIDYRKLARHLCYNSSPEQIAQALERAAMEARIDERTIYMPQSSQHRLEELRARLAELKEAGK